MQLSFLKLTLLALIGFQLLTPLGSLAIPLSSLKPGANDILVNHEGQSRRLIITTPNHYTSEASYPILFCFHGAGGKADGPSNRFSPHIENYGLILISAEAIRPLAKWNFKQNFHSVNYDDVGFIAGVVETLIDLKIANPQRVYATGHSSGGLFCYRLAKETDLFAALAPMSCGMAEDAHEPGAATKPVSILQVIGDNDKSYHGSTNPKITMYSAEERIEIWRRFNQCSPNPTIKKHGEEIVWYTYTNPDGIEVVFGQVKDQEHHIRRDLRDATDLVALDFLFRHQKR